MGNVRIRKVGDTGGLKFRRNLNINWSTEAELTPETIIGSEGDLIQAITFGDPYSSETKGPISVHGTTFQYFKLIENINIESSTGIAHKVVDGPFFKLRESNLTTDVKSLVSLGAWVNNLPPDSHLNLMIEGLIPDNFYQIRCIFADGKNRVSSRLFLGPGNHEINYNRQTGCVATGTFTAPDKNATIRIASQAIEPPHINSIVIRKIGYNPRTVATVLKTISDSKS